MLGGFLFLHFPIQHCILSPDTVPPQEGPMPSSTKECLLATTSRVAVCALALAAQLRNEGGVIPPECAEFKIDMGDPADGHAEITFRVPATP